MKIAIGIAHHKEGHYFKEYPYIPIQVGAAINLKELGIQKDSEGDNISLMNAYCSEFLQLIGYGKIVQLTLKAYFIIDVL